ncbi:unnamed protein product [Cunninghamella blakesleeana]
MQLIHPNEPITTTPTSTLKQQELPTTKIKNQLDFKHNEPITNLDTSNLPPTAKIMNCDNDKTDNKNSNNSATIKTKNEVKKVAPFQLQVDVNNLEDNTKNNNENDISEEEKQLQEQANLWIEQSNRRRSTLPVYSNLDRYEIIQKLGDGAFSNVYRAKDKRTGRKVAIKAAQKRTDSNPQTDLQHLHPNMKKKPRVTERANILKEVQIMRNIHHPNIVQLIQFLESDENYFLVLDLCEGGELFYRIVDLTYFSEDLAKHIMSQLAQAVYHLHEECGIVHRDIKPENILFDPIPIIPNENRKLNVFDDASKKDEGVFIPGKGGGGISTVKLADFGLSKIIWDKDTLTPCGTVGYTAPEIVCDQKYSKGVDMWALGCVLYTMLCGFPPFYDESLSNLSRKVARGEFAFLSPWWDPISDEAKDLIRGLLCVDPTKRYTVIQVLQHPWLNDIKPVIPQPTSIQRDYSSYSESDSIRIQAMRNAAMSSVIKSTTTPNSNNSNPSLDFKLNSPPINNNNDSNNTTDPIIYTQQQSSTTTFSDVDSCSSSTRRKDIFSPGAPTLREIFDITAAVQRMAEENVHRGDSMKLDEHDNQLSTINVNISNGTNKTSTTKHEHPMQANIKKNRQPGGFNLNLNNSTLLKNRKAKQVI